MKKFYRSTDLARAAGISPQSVRNYEQSKIIPEANRTPKGYRMYTPQHLHALRVSRTMVGGYGWDRTRRIMPLIHQGNIPAALALMDAHHAQIHRDRTEVEAMLHILRTTLTTLPPPVNIKDRPWRNRSTYINDAARRVGVRVSTLRHWEAEGLLQPARERDNSYRTYDNEQLRTVQIVSLLRRAGYRIEEIRPVLAQLAAGSPESAMIAAEKRLKDLAEASRRCVRASAALWTYLESLPDVTGDQQSEPCPLSE